MKKLLFSMLFVLVSLFVFGKNTNTQMVSSKILELDLSVNTMNLYQIDIQEYVKECTVTITATINIAGSGVEVSVAATASTCAQAAKDALAGITDIKKALL